jgi:hypothetical protein
MEERKNIKIEKNFLPPIFYNKLKSIITCNTFPWYYLPKTVGYSEDSFMFNHTLLSFGETYISSNWFKDFEPILYFLNDKIKLKKLVRMRVNLYTNQNKAVEHTAHVDISKKGHADPNVTISILNFTTCNGGTVIKGKKYPSNENELLIFNNINKHFGIVQTDTQSRIVLNIATN